MTKKLLIISPSLKLGGIERALTNLANYFVTQNIEVIFLSCLKGKSFYTLDPRIKIIEPSFKRKGGILNKILFYPQLLNFIKNNYNIEKPDVVLSFGDAFNPLVLLALYSKKLPIYISDRTSPDYNFKFPIPFLKKWLYPKSAGFIAQTTRAAKFKKEQFGDNLNVRIIPNALKEIKINSEVRENIILYVGRFAWEKGPQYLIEAFAALENAREWKLMMAGSGPMLEEMISLSKSLNIEDRVEFLGDVKDVDLLYARARIYVLPSIIEGFPNSLVEAMAAGLASICFDQIPHEDIFINPDMGIVCKEPNSNALSIELDALIVDEKYICEIGRNASTIKNYLNIKNIGSQYLNFMNLNNDKLYL